MDENTELRGAGFAVDVLGLASLVVGVREFSAAVVDVNKYAQAEMVGTGVDSVNLQFGNLGEEIGLGRTYGQLYHDLCASIASSAIPIGQLTNFLNEAIGAYAEVEGKVGEGISRRRIFREGE